MGMLKNHFNQYKISFRKCRGVTIENVPPQLARTGQFHSDRYGLWRSVSTALTVKEFLSDKVSSNSNDIVYNIHMDIYIATEIQEKRSI